MKAVIYFMLHFLRMKEESITERGCRLKELINIYRQQENGKFLYTLKRNRL